MMSQTVTGLNDVDYTVDGTKEIFETQNSSQLRATLRMERSYRNHRSQDISFYI